MQFFEGSENRKMPLSGRVQQGEHTGAVRCLQEDVSCLTHSVPDHSLCGSELKPLGDKYLVFVMENQILQQNVPKRKT